MVEGGGLLNRYTGLNPVSRVQIPPSPPTYFGSITCEIFYSEMFARSCCCCPWLTRGSLGLNRFKNDPELRACGLDILK